MAQQHINYSTANDGLGDTLRTSQVKTESNFNELYANKVDKVIGKVLSDTNYTQAEKDQLSALVAAGPNVQSDMTEGNSASPAFIKNKFTNTSDFFNDGDGTQAFVPDTGSASPQVRVAGSWEPLSGVQLQPYFFPILATPNQDFVIPSGKTAVFGFINQAIQFPADASNITKNYTFTQAGNIVTLKTVTISGNLITLFIQ